MCGAGLGIARSDTPSSQNFQSTLGQSKSVAARLGPAVAAGEAAGCSCPTRLTPPAPRALAPLMNPWRCVKQACQSSTRVSMQQGCKAAGMQIHVRRCRLRRSTNFLPVLRYGVTMGHPCTTRSSWIRRRRARSWLSSRGHFLLQANALKQLLLLSSRLRCTTEPWRCSPAALTPLSSLC